MDLISKLEKRFGSWAIPNLTVYLLIIQLSGVVLLYAEKTDVNNLVLYGNALIHQGEWWRLLSFMMLPKTLSPVWLFFVYYVFMLVGNSLEHHWGTFRYNLFILVGYLLAVAMAFIKPNVIIYNTYFLASIFLAFATLYPNVEFRLYFVLPVKAKWLGWLTVAGFCLVLISNDIGGRLSVVAAFTTYGLFFGRDFIRGLKAGKRRKAFVAENKKVEAAAMHECAKCGITDKSDPDAHFRYCSTCGKCFCEKHIGDHEH